MALKIRFLKKGSIYSIVLIIKIYYYIKILIIGIIFIIQQHFPVLLPCFNLCPVKNRLFITFYSNIYIYVNQPLMSG